MTLNEYMIATESATDDFDSTINHIETFLEKNDESSFDERYFTSRSNILSKLQKSTEHLIKTYIDSSDSFMSKNATKSVIDKLDKRIIEMPETKSVKIKYYDVKAIKTSYLKHINLFDKRINMLKINKNTDDIGTIQTQLKIALNKARSLVDIKATNLKTVIDSCMEIMNSSKLDMSVYTLNKDWTKEIIDDYINTVKARDVVYCEMLNVIKKILIETIYAFKAVINDKASDYSPSEIIKEYTIESVFDIDENTINIDLYLDDLITRCKTGEEYITTTEMADIILSDIESEIADEIVNESASDIESIENMLNKFNITEGYLSIEESADNEEDEYDKYDNILDNIIGDLL